VGQCKSPSTEEAWKKALVMVMHSGIDTVTLKYVSRAGKIVETQVEPSRLSPSSLIDGVFIEETKEVLFPNPHSVMINPFVDTPSAVIVCDLNKENAAHDYIHEFVPEDQRLPVSSQMKLTDPASTPSHSQDVIDPTYPVCISAPPPSSVLPQSKSAGIQVQATRATIPASIEAQYGEAARQTGQRGTSCHQCKNARSIEQLAFCSNLFNKRTKQDFRTCRKKYCEICLRKFYNESLETARQPDWVCPSCRGVCRCAACTRKRNKNPELAALKNGAEFSFSGNTQQGANAVSSFGPSGVVAPSVSIACSGPMMSMSTNIPTSIGFGPSAKPLKQIHRDEPYSSGPSPMVG
jgi:hypothetical protein